MIKRNFFILGLLLLIGFLILPGVGLTIDLKDIDLRTLGKYLVLPENRVQDLIYSLIGIFQDEFEDMMTAHWDSPPYPTSDEMAVPSIMKKAAQVQTLNHLLVDAPFQVAWGIVNNTVKIARLIGIKDISVILDELEKESVKKVTEYGMNFLLQNEIRVAPGAMSFKYTSQKENQKEALFQYIMIYQSIDAKKGKVLIRLYSPNPLELPENRGSGGGVMGTYTELTANLPPFIVDIRGTVEDYKWVGEPLIDIDFPPEVPDLGIKPLSFWERNILQPIKTTIKEVEVIITKVTGGKKVVEDISKIVSNIWNTLKSTISQLNPFMPAAIVQPSLPMTIEEEVAVLESEEIKEIEEETAVLEEKITEAKPEALAELTLEELQKQLDDIAEQIDILIQKVAELTVAKEQKIKKEKTEKEELGEEELEELEEKKKGKEKDICWVNINTASVTELQKITGVGPVLAQRIIEARPFYSLHDLLKVKGIGSATLQKILAQGCAYVNEFYSQFTGSAGGTASGGGAPPPLATDSSPSYLKILISEIQIASISNTNDEFIELYNPNDQEVDISQWSIQISYSTSTIVYKKNFESGNKISAKGYFLIVNASSSDQNLLNLAGMVHKSFSLSKNNTVYLVKNREQIESATDSDIIDLVGFGQNVFSEGNHAPTPPAGRSIGRKWSTTTESYIDTDNNQVDFEIQTPTPKAQNQSLELEEEQGFEPVQNLLVNEFFEEWEEDGTKPAYWTGSHSFKTNWFQDTDALRGNYSVRVGTTATTTRTLSQVNLTIEAGNYYAVVYLKGGGEARVGITRGDTDIATYGNWIPIFIDEWTIITHSRESVMAGSLGGIRIQTRGNQVNTLIGAAWLGTAPPPEWWPHGLPPNKVEDFAIDTQNSYSNNVRLIWTTDTDPDTPSENLFYEIYYSKEALNESNLTQASVASTTATSTLISGLDYNSIYYFGIKAFDPENNSSTLATTTPYKTATLSLIADGFDPNLTIVNNGRKIVRASNGNLYVVYSKDDKIFLAKSIDGGQNWSDEDKIAVTPDGTATTTQKDPAIAIDSQDNLHIVWSGIVPNISTSTYQIRYRKYDGAWQAIENLTNAEKQDQKAPVIAVDSQNNIHLAWIDGRKIYYRVGAGGNWGNVEIVKDYEYGWEMYSSISQFSFAIDHQNVLHFVWFETIPTGWGSYTNLLRYLKGSSGNWSEIKNLTSEIKNLTRVGLQNYSSIIIDSQNNVHIVWHEPDNRDHQGWYSLINYINYTNDWGQIETLSEEKNNYVIASPSIAIDSKNYLYVVWKGWDFKPVSQIEYKDGIWQEVKELILPFEWQGFPNLLYQPNQPKTGYAFIFYEGTKLKFYASQDLTWE
ncbi:MAG: helix-hairpin-helix domain-containing protein [Patescibacteria group bacterium]|nr:helix-hairpin-helix domain-containing protein [Patescibacteria group bacterium]